MRPFLIAGIVVIVDQITKAIATTHLTLVRNTGAAFGLFRDQAVIFILISVIAIIFIGFYLIKKKTSYYLPLALILGGAVGNLIDRLRFGYVVDFIDLRFWPVFNVADSCITIGAIILFFVIIRSKDVSRPL
ncbi:MAG: signal peptidase II [Candidatus Omnitrophota bacterium]|nr:signal peptidase II [Candidatus Omnitrophota bacterium]